MGVVNADFLFLQFVLGAERDFYFAAPVDRVGVLGNLVAFGQIRIKIMLALKGRHFIGFTAQRQPGAHGQAHRAFIHNGQRARSAAAAGTDFAVGAGAFVHAVGAGAKHFGFAGQLYMYFQSDNGFKLGSHVLPLSNYYNIKYVFSF